MHLSIIVRRSMPIFLAILLACTATAPSEGPVRVEPAGASTQDLAAASSSAAQIDAYLDSIYGSTDPGAAVLVSRAGETIMREAYGMADLELGVELRPEHVLHIGSVTKQFTAIAVLMLAEEGKLDLEDEITKFLTDYPTHGHRITIEKLLHHTSGIRSYTSMPQAQALMREDLDVDSLIGIFRNEPLEFAPGEDWRYSNSGYVLLGKIIEEASGRPYADFVRERIFEPAGMTSSHYGSASHIVPNRVRGYERTRSGWRNADYLSMTIPYAAGALLSTVDDLERWNQALERGELVTSELLERAHTSAVLADGRRTGYGYGWQVGRVAGREAIEHDGEISGFSSHVLHIPSEAVFIVVLANREGGPDSDEVGLQIARRVLGETGELRTVSVPVETLEDFVGVYRINEYERREITLENGRLYSQRAGAQKLEILPVAQDVFVYRSGTQVEFERNGSGEVVRMRVRPRAGPETVATKFDGASLRPPALDLPVSVLERYTGEYEYAPDVVISVRLENGSLRAKMTGLPEVPLEAESETRFRAVGPSAWLDFKIGKKGLAEEAVVFLDGRETRAPRIR